MTVINGIPMVHIPMVQIPHPQGPWLEGVNPVTNAQWREGVKPLMAGGARYCLLEPHYRGDLMARQFGSLETLLDTVGRDKIPENWDGRTNIRIGGGAAVFQWHPDMSPQEFDGDNQPVVNVGWHHAKGWALSQGGLYYLLTPPQWRWSAQGGEMGLRYATRNGELFGSDGRRLVHCSIGTKELTTIDVDDRRYPDGPFRLRHKTGNVGEWTERSPDYVDRGYYEEGDELLDTREPAERYQTFQLGGFWRTVNPADLLTVPTNPLRNMDIFSSDAQGNNATGFRVGAALPQPPHTVE